MLYVLLLALCALFSPEMIAQAKKSSSSRSSSSSSSSASAPEFVILILSYNNEKYVWDNMRWGCHQKSTKPYKVICVNDCSTDRTGELMEQYVREHGLESMVTIIHNTENKGMTRNTYETIHNYIEDHKVVVKYDGDDKLANDNVLLRLEKEYKKGHVWLTYGQAIRIPGGELLSKRIPDDVFYDRTHRQWGFSSIALRSFKAGLFKKIRQEDLMHEGKYYKMSGDEAYMFPMLEMSSPVDDDGKIHAVFIPDILYFYNVVNPLNDHNLNKKMQTDMAKIIRSKQPYRPIVTL